MEMFKVCEKETRAREARQASSEATLIAVRLQREATEAATEASTRAARAQRAAEQAERVQ